MVDRNEAQSAHSIDVPLAKETTRPKRSPKVIAIATIAMMFVALVTMILGIYVLATT